MPNTRQYNNKYFPEYDGNMIFNLHIIYSHFNSITWLIIYYVYLHGENVLHQAQCYSSLLYTYVTIAIGSKVCMMDIFVIFIYNPRDNLKRGR